MLITDADNRITLSILRSLAKRNIEAAVTSESQLALSLFSRHCKRRILCPSSTKDLDGFLATIHNIVKKKKFDTIFPATDWSLITISEHRDRLSPYVKLPLPSHESVKKVFDKSLTITAATEEGIPTPKTFFVKNTAQLKDAAKKVKNPAVIKPRWSWIWNRGEAIHNRPFYVNSASELLSCYSTVHEVFPFPLIQEYVPGENVSVAVLVDHGEPKAACGIRVHRMMPVTGGNSVFRESVSLDQHLKRHALTLLRKLEWHGVAEVEFRIDSRDSTQKLMEVNGRFWASLDVAIESGVDFPYLLYRLIMEDRIDPVFSYKTGVKFRWLVGDVQHLFSVLKGEPRLISFRRPSRLRTFLNFLRFYEKDLHYDCLASDDPLPFFMVGRIINLLQGYGLSHRSER